MFEIEDIPEEPNTRFLVLKEIKATANKLKVGQSFLVDDVIIDSLFDSKERTISVKEFKTRLILSVRKFLQENLEIKKKFNVVGVVVGIRIFRVKYKKDVRIN